jgi:hypothetical protein
MIDTGKVSVTAFRGAIIIVVATTLMMAAFQGTWCIPTTCINEFRRPARGFVAVMVPLDIMTTFFGRISTTAAVDIIDTAVEGIYLTSAKPLFVLGCMC